MPSSDAAPAAVAVGNSASGWWLRVLVSGVILVLLLVLAALQLHRYGVGLANGGPLTGRAGTAPGVMGAFTVSSQITALPACSQPATLAPGIDRCIMYTIHNTSAAPITVTAVSIADVEAVDTCPASELDIARSAFAGELAIPAGGTASTPGLPIALRETGRDQDGCRNATFGFTFTGTARVEEATK